MMSSASISRRSCARNGLPDIIVTFDEGKAALAEVEAAEEIVAGGESQQ